MSVRPKPLRRWFSLAFALLFAGCADDATEPISVTPGQGAVFVRVLDSEGNPVSSANVLTRPASQQSFTGPLGTVLLEGVVPGTYTVWATHATEGSGNGAVQVRDGQLRSVDILVTPETILQPITTIEKPATGDHFPQGVPIEFRATTQDREDRPGDLRLVWTSSLDGVLAEGQPNPKYYHSFTYDSLSEGMHSIVLTVTDTDGWSSRNELTLTIGSVPPTLEVLSPRTGESFAPGETIDFEVRVSDHESSNSELSVEWTSDLDGNIGSVTPDASGFAALRVTTLSRGVHTLECRVTDPDGNSVAESLVVNNAAPPGLEDFSAQTSGGIVTLRWSTYDSPEFSQYCVFRSLSEGGEGERTATLEDRETTAFVDDLAPLWLQAYYWVAVENQQGELRLTKRVKVSEPGGLILNTIPTEVLFHPQEDWLYAELTSTLYLVDVSMMEIVRTGPAGVRDSWMDLADNGQGLELYLPQNGFIQILDPVSLFEVDRIQTGTLGVSVATSGRGIVYQSSLSLKHPLRSYSRSTGFQLDGGGELRNSRIRTRPSGVEVLSIRNTSDPDLDYDRFDEDGMFIEHSDDGPHGGKLSGALFEMSPSGEFLITSDQGAVYAANSGLGYLGEVQRASRRFRAFAFDEVGRTVYAAVSGERLIQVYEFPSLRLQAQLPTRGYPRFLGFRGESLVAISDTPYGSGDRAGVELIRIAVP